MFRAIRSISVSSYLHQAIDAVVWLQTDLVSNQPMRIRTFNSRMIDGSFTHDQRMAIFRRDKVFAKPARTAVGTTGKQITSFLGRTAARLLSRMVRSPVWSRNASKEGMIQPAA